MKRKTFFTLPAVTLFVVGACDFEVDGDVSPLPEHQIYSTVIDCGSIDIPKEVPKRVMYLAGPKRPDPFKNIDPDKPIGAGTSQIEENSQEPANKSAAKRHGRNKRTKRK